MTIAELCQLLAPFVAVVSGVAWMHGQFSRLREELAALKVHVHYLEQELQRLRGERP